ncbi:AzlC family ABC transporter permease [Falsarthrobacter nasiphocae]|uniref:AzlC family ABC transporter permease n=1 Tax=Falsarthrobacter nasiphocae TaxID=189863 RepID=UPI00286ADE0C|nr:AzlC family ABC transporter permease [Falsarthrobacter nasiphocae]
MTPWHKTGAFKTGAALSVATGLYAISFGALSVAAGLSVLQTMVLSVFLLSGGSQFAFIGVLAGGGAGASAFGASTLLGVRNAVYGMQVNALVRPSRRLRPLAAHVTIDESAAVSSAQPTARERSIGFWVTGVGVWILWSLLTLVGALAGSRIGDPAAWGLDGAAVAAFLGLLWPRLRQRDSAGVAVVSALATALAVPFVPPGIPIIVAAVVAGFLGWRSVRGGGASGASGGGFSEAPAGAGSPASGADDDGAAGRPTGPSGARGPAGPSHEGSGS